MKSIPAGTVRAFLIELVIYSALVVVYFFLVLHFLGDWLNQLEPRHIRTYAFVSVGVMIVQAILLERVTTWLMRRLQGRSE
jgi:heme A synthase